MTICSNCGKELIGKRKSFCNKACADEWQRAYPNKGSFKNQSGPNNAHWKGGLTLHSKGYVYEYAPDSEMADKRGYVLQHRLRVSERLGRPLREDEIVDHADENKRQNEIHNLHIYDNAGHSRKHVSQMARDRGRFVGKVHQG
jgi:hypothetical protein